MINTAAGTLSRRLAYRRDLLRVLVVRDMKLRYKRSYLGILWTLVHPLAQLLVYHFVFTEIFRVSTPNFVAYLFVGLTAWNWFSVAVLEATSSIVGNADLIRHPGFPSIMLPGVTVGSHLIHYLLTLPVLFGLLVTSDIPITGAVALLPVVIAVQYLLTLACSVLAACVHVKFRDTQYLLGVFFMLAFFLTPILYELTAVPERFQPLFRVNPMTHLVDAYRAVLIRGELPDPGALAMLTAIGLVLLGLSCFLFHRISATFVEEL